MSAITKTAVTVVFRVDKIDGDVLAIFSGEEGTRSPDQDALAYSGKGNGHFTVSRGWYEQYTRPATASESQPVWDALLARGYDVTRANRMVWA